jgi:hypothetical protein
MPGSAAAPKYLIERKNITISRIANEESILYYYYYYNQADSEEKSVSNFTIQKMRRQFAAPSISA